MGYVKAENVLICSGNDRKFVAKFGDFGFSVVTATGVTDRWMGRTIPWKPPEIHTPVPVQSAFYTDIYSLGLLLWLIYIDGMNPFDLVVDAKWQGLARIKEIGRQRHHPWFSAMPRLDQNLIFSSSWFEHVTEDCLAPDRLGQNHADFERASWCLSRPFLGNNYRAPGFPIHYDTTERL